MSPLNRRDFLRVTAGAVVSTVIPVENILPTKPDGEGQMLEDAILEAVGSMEWNTLVFDALVKQWVTTLRDTSIPLKQRAAALKNLVNWQNIYEGQRPAFVAACKKYDVDNLLLGRDPIYAENPAFRKHCEEIVEDNVDLVQRLQKLQISEIMRDLLAHKQSEQDKEISSTEETIVS